MKKIIIITLLFFPGFNFLYGQVTQSDQYPKSWELEFTSIVVFNSINIYKDISLQNNGPINYSVLYGLNIPFSNYQDKFNMAADIDFLGHASYQIFNSFRISSEIGVTYRRIIYNYSSEDNGLNVKYGLGLNYEFNDNWNLILKTDQLFPNKKMAALGIGFRYCW